MPIGKDSIQKRVAKAAPAEAEAPEKVAAPAETPVEAPAEKKPAPRKKAPAAPKAESAKTEAPKATAPKKAPAKKPAAKAEAPKTEPATAVMGNVAPETVEKVVGHAEKAPVEHVQIGAKMPTHLL